MSLLPDFSTLGHMRLLFAFACLLVASSQALPRWVGFQARMDHQIERGRFQPGQDQLLLRGSFNDWSGQDSLQWSEDSLWTLLFELPSVDHHWKLVIQHETGDLTWETGEDRLLPAAWEGWLAPVWFSNDSLAALPPIDVECLVEIELHLMIELGQFDPDQHQLAILGSHPDLGAWQPPGQLLPLDTNGTLAAGWIELESLSSEVIEWKAVILDQAANVLQWESGDNSTLQRTGDEPDLQPSGGNGLPELPAIQRYFDRQQGWTPDQLTIGSDLSHLPRLESMGAVYHDTTGASQQPLLLFSNAGHGLVRLRLWVDPAEAWHGLDSTLAHAHRVVDAGFDWMLDFHYSDTWADPGQQTTPAGWQDLGLQQLGDTLAAYTARVLRRCCEEGISPSHVQIGNETNPGMLWPLGRVGGAWDTPAQWDQLAFLLGRALDGARDSLAVDCRPRSLFHLANSGCTPCVTGWIAELQGRGVHTDGVGLSYYPWWHGDLAGLAATLDALEQLGIPELMVVETAYPWTLDWQDDIGNFVGSEDQLLPGFPASPAGQQAFATALAALLRMHGASQMIWWEPAYIAQPGFGSPWENLALFDFDGLALPALHVPGSGLPSVPLLDIVSLGSGLLELQWLPVNGASSYRIESSTRQGAWQPVHQTSATNWLTTANEGVHLFRVTAESGGSSGRD